MPSKSLPVELSQYISLTLSSVDFWFFGFDIQFGAGREDPPPLPLSDFWATTHSPGPTSADRPDNDQDPQQTLVLSNPDAGDASIQPVTPSPAPTPIDGAAFKFVLQTGNFPQATKPTILPLASTGSTTPPPAPPITSTGAGAKWFVKGGTFQFGIMTGFALSAANIAGTSEQYEGPLSLPAATDPIEQVFSRPCHVSTRIKSTLTITIEHIVGSQRKTVGGWLNVAFIRKNVPSALWASYDATLDVAQLDPTGPPPSDLLNGAAATISLALGVSLTAPKPVLSISWIPAFNATEAASAGVLDLRPDHLVKVGNSLEGADWYIPPFEPVQTRFLAADLTPAEKGMDAQTRWAEVQSTWGGLKTQEQVVGDNVNGVLVLAATEIFGWNLNRPQAELATTVVGSEPWRLKGDLPGKLIGELMDDYLALPRFSVQ